MPYANEYTVELTSFVYGGECMGRLPDGRAVFIPYTLPGERVRARLVEEKPHFARAALLEVLSPAPQRMTPRCPHFTVCGGCHYQHLDYTQQVTVKEEILRQQLQRIAGIANPPLMAMQPSLQAWNYRNSAQFHLTPRGKLGFQAAGSHDVVEIGECHLLDAWLEDAWRSLDIEGTDIHLVETRCNAAGDVLVILHGNEAQPPSLYLDIPFSVVHISPYGEVILAGENHLAQVVADRSFSVSAASFFQINTPQAEAMVSFVLACLPDLGGASVMDVYCGVGLFSAFLAPQAHRVIGIESSPSACLDFAINLNEFDNVVLYEGAAERILPALNEHIDIVIVDPPRSGLASKALNALLNLSPPLLVYVSCDPSTLARDAKRLLAGGYHLQQVQPFDMFPQTHHIESISLFECFSDR